MEAKKLQERIAKCEAKIEKLEGTLSKHLTKLQKIYKKYTEATVLHGVLPVDVFTNFDTETYYSFADEMKFSDEIGGFLSVIHNQNACKLYKLYNTKAAYSCDDVRREVRNFLYDAEQVASAIVDKRREIKEVQKQVGKYQSELQIQNSRMDGVKQLFDKVPMLKMFIDDCGKRQYDYLIKQNKELQLKWDAYYKADREACEIWNTGKCDDYREKVKEAKKLKPKSFVRSEEQIKEEVEHWKINESKLMAERIKTEFGEVTGTYLHLGADGNVNGVIQGTNKTALIETIFAGGYNIQCLHTRLLIHEK